MDASNDETLSAQQQQHQQQQQFYEHSWKSPNHGNSLSDSRDYDTNSTRTSLTGSPPITASSLQLDFNGFEDKALLASLMAPKLDPDCSGSGSSSSIYTGEQQVLQPLGLSLTLKADDDVLATRTTTYTLYGAQESQTQNNNIDNDDIDDDDEVFTLRPLTTTTTTNAPLLLTSTTNTSSSPTHHNTHTVTPISSHHTTSTASTTQTSIPIPIEIPIITTVGTYNLDDICFTLEYQFQNQKLVQVQPPTVVSFSMVSASEDPTITTTEISSADLMQQSNNNNNSALSSASTTPPTAYFTLGTR